MLSSKDWRKINSHHEDVDKRMKRENDDFLRKQQREGEYQATKAMFGKRIADSMM